MLLMNDLENGFICHGYATLRVVVGFYTSEIT
jgi:hypothetical protein